MEQKGGHALVLVQKGCHVSVEGRSRTEGQGANNEFIGGSLGLGGCTRREPKETVICLGHG